MYLLSTHYLSIQIQDHVKFCYRFVESVKWPRLQSCFCHLRLPKEKLSYLNLMIQNQQDQDLKPGEARLRLNSPRPCRAKVKQASLSTNFYKKQYPTTNQYLPRIQSQNLMFETCKIKSCLNSKHHVLLYLLEV